MAALTLYFKDAVPSGATLHRSLQDGGSAPGTATTTTGWVAGQNASGQSCIQNGGSEISRTDNQWSATLRPSTGPSQTTGDCWRSENTYTGGFSNTDWTFALGIRSVTAAFTGRLKLAVRVWRGTDANGTGAVEMTSGRVVSAATSANLSTSADTTVTCTWSTPGLHTLTGEYLFVNVGIELTSAGSGNTQDVDFRVGSAYTIATANFTPSVALTNVLGTLSAGSVHVSRSLAGLSAIGSVGTLTPPSGQAVVTWAEVQGGIALTGVAATGSTGTVTPALDGTSVALTGVSATGSPGSVTPVFSVALSGIAGTGSIGAPAVGILQSGVSATGSVGSPSVGILQIGVSATGSLGTLTPEASIALSGQAATGSPGSVTANDSIALSGVSATGSQGTVATDSDVNVALSGVEGTLSAGSVVATADCALTGISTTGSPGSVAVVVSLALSGQEATSSVGTILPNAPVDLELSGVEATADVDAVGVSVEVDLTGFETTGDVGSVEVSGQISLTPASIESAEAFGTPSIVLGVKPGIVAPAVWPSDAVFRDLWIRPNGIRSAESFGVVTVELEQPVRGIDAQESLGRARISVSIQTQSIGMSDVMGRIAPELEIGGFSIDTRAEVSRAFTALGPRHRKQRDAEVWLLRR